ncbi:sodium-dependent glucose transporter 1-like [Dreissena polymorpha]|nr:sodium-dependent glucose transporter 1-like [Dreissena polymorpha]
MIAFVTKVFQERAFRKKIVYTVWICSAFVMLGWVEALFGPTFSDLRLIVGKNLETASWLFTATSSGFLVGSILTGMLFDKYNRVVIMILAIVGTAITQLAIPWCSMFPLMITTKFLSGVMCAVLDAGGNAEVIGTWGSESGPCMQALHFCFSVGGIIATFVATPFLAETITSPTPYLAETVNSSAPFVVKTVTYPATFLIEKVTDSRPYFAVSATIQAPFLDAVNSSINNAWYMSTSNEHNATEPTWSAYNRTIQDMSVDNSTNTYESLYGESRIFITYAITAGIIFLTAVSFVTLICINGTNRTKEVHGQNEADEPTNFHSLSTAKKLLLLLLLSLLMFVYVGMEDTFAGYLMTFLLEQLKWGKPKGALATSVFWMAFGISRMAGIPLVRAFQLRTMMLIFSTLTIVAFAGLLFATVYDMNNLVWLFIVGVGMSTSIIFAAIFFWTNEHVVCVSGKISGMFLTSASAGIMVFPLIFGYTMENISPIWFVYILIGQSITWVCLFLVTISVTNSLLTLRPNSTPIETHIAHRSETTRL